MAIHTVMNSTRMAGSYSVAFMVNVKITEDFDNGSVVSLVGPAAGEVEAFEIAAPAEGAELHALAIICEPEVMYDERLHNLDDFYNIAGEGRVVRAYLPKHGDEFALSKEGFAGEPAVGATVGVGSGYKFVVGGTGFGKIVAILNGLFVIRVD